MGNAVVHLRTGLGKVVIIPASRRLLEMLLSVLVLWAVLAAPADACQICVPLPEKTLADRLLASDAVVLAREDPERPFYYAVIETLKGDPGGESLDAFMNSQARRRLAVYPERRMLLARNPLNGKWATLGITGPEFDRVVRRILSFSGTWTPMETDNPTRIEEFAPLLGHPDSRLHELAYLEIGRAPYASIRRISAEVSIETVRTILDDPRYLEWRSLAIVLLAQSELPEDRARIIETLERKQRFGGTLNLAAWAAACIAVAHTSCIERLERLYFTHPDRSRQELQQVVQAMSVHGAEDRALRERIVVAYGALLNVHPAMASGVVRDLIAWQRWDFAERIGGIRESWGQADPLGAYSLARYLRMAKAHQGSPSTTDGKHTGEPQPEVSTRSPSNQPTSSPEAPSADRQTTENPP